MNQMHMLKIMMYMPTKAVVPGHQEAIYVETLGEVQNVFIHDMEGVLVAVHLGREAGDRPF
jgi:hypothetical protein